MLLDFVCVAFNKEPDYVITDFAMLTFRRGAGTCQRRTVNNLVNNCVLG